MDSECNTLMYLLGGNLAALQIFFLGEGIAYRCVFRVSHANRDLCASI